MVKMTNKINPYPKRLVYISYRDHVLVRNLELGYFKPTIRETVGWIKKENSLAVWILWDKNFENTGDEMFDEQSGLIILKSCILELKVLKVSEATGMGLCRIIANQPTKKSENG